VGLSEDEAIPEAMWQDLLARVPFITSLNPQEQTLLRELASQFLCSREWVGIGTEITPWQEAVIAVYASLPVLHLGIRQYDDWRTVLVYPDTFAPEHEWVDDDGVAHRAIEPQAGEAWERGPVILSWADVELDGAVVVHEMLHTLDARQDGTNGFPELGDRTLAQRWTEAFSKAYAELLECIEVGEEPLIDPYAGTAPAEFLAVVGEYFFFEPARLREVYPQLYDLLATWLGQEPHLRAASIATALRPAGSPPWHTLDPIPPRANT
jgi:Mlc titration factor MtfA (ptsG expression regulator)